MIEQGNFQGLYKKKFNADMVLPNYIGKPALNHPLPNSWIPTEVKS